MKIKRYSGIIALVLSIVLVFACFAGLSGCNKKPGNPGDGGGVTTPPEGGGDADTEVFEMREVKADYDENGIYTLSQVNMNYSPSLALPLDCMLAYSDWNTASTKIKGYLDKGYKEVGIMIALGRDAESYYVGGRYDGKKHEDIVQARVSTADKSSWRLHSGNTYYVCPTLDFCRYLVDMCMKGVEAGASIILIEEPDYWVTSGFEDAYKEEWKNYYGTEWVAFDSADPSNRYMHAELKAYIMTRAVDYITAEIKKQAPETEIVICSHSSADYNHHRIAANNYDILSLENVDGMVLQAWTDTTGRDFNLKNKYEKFPFEYAYMEYSEGINYARALNKRIYALNDPLADNEGIRDIAYNYYMEDIAAATVNPDINAFEVVWPDRYLWSEGWYKSMQESVYQLLNDMAKKDAVSYSGSNGIGVVTGYNIVAEGKNKNFAQDCITALACSLISGGVPVNVLSLEAIKSADYLKDIHTLILSYEFIKPTYVYNGYNSDEYRTRMIANDVIAQWVKDGGSLIFVGEGNDSKNLELWWSDMGYESPQEHLFSLLDLDVSIENCSRQSSISLVSSSDAEYMENYDINVQSEESTAFRLYSYTIDGGNSLYTWRDEASGKDRDIISEKAAGKGHVILAGVSPTVFSLGGDNTYKLLYSLVERAMEVQDKKFLAPGYMYSERGDWIIAKTFDGVLNFEGLYFDIFTTREDFVDIKVFENRTVEKNTSAVMKKIEEKDDPYLIHANGTIQSVTYGDSGADAVIKNLCKNSAYDATYGISVWWTAGRDVKDVYVYYDENNGGKEIDAEYYVDDYGILHIIYHNTTVKDSSAIIEIKWK